MVEVRRHAWLFGRLCGSGVLRALSGDLMAVGGVGQGGSKLRSCLGEEPTGLYVERQAAAMALKPDRTVNDAEQ